MYCSRSTPKFNDKIPTVVTILILRKSIIYLFLIYKFIQLTLFTFFFSLVYKIHFHLY